MRAILHGGLVLGQFFCLVQSDYTDLNSAIAALSSDRIETRMKAAEYLKHAGEEALPILEKARIASGNLEVQSILAEVISSIKGRSKLLWVRPKPIRMSLEMKDSAASTVLARISDHFHVSPSVVPASLSQRKISIYLNNSTMWEAFGTFARESQCKISDDLEFGPLQFADKSDGSFVRSCDREDLRILAWHYGSEKDQSGNADLIIAVDLLAPERVWIDNYVLHNVSIIDDRGKQVQASAARESIRTPTCKREFHVPTRASGRRLKVPQSEYNGVRSISVKGALEVTFPDAIQEQEVGIEVVEAQRSEGLDWDFGKVVLSWKAKSQVFECKVSGEASQAGFSLQVSAFDDVERWICDAASFRAPPLIEYDFAPEIHRFTIAPRRLVLWKVSKGVTTEIPFEIRNVPIRPTR